jgi:uncharacterized protein (DUF2141 family)
MIIFLIALMLNFGLHQSPSLDFVALPKVSITLVITNIAEVRGQMRAAIFNRAEGFRDEQFAVVKMEFPVNAERVTHTFTDLPPGSYAIAVYHDANSNGKLDTNFLGIPTERYGFSNNVMGTFGPPSYADASFEILGGNKVISIRLR